MRASEDDYEVCLNRCSDIEAKYSSLKDEVEELRKRAEDGQAAHLEDVTLERAKYEKLKAFQDNFRQRYQAGDIVSELDVYSLSLYYILTAHNGTIDQN